MKIIVLDTNCLLQILPRKSSKRWLLNFIREGKVMLALSTDILSEYAEILEQRTNSEVSENVVQALLDSPFVLMTEPSYRWQLIHVDADDNKFVDCAVAANADYLITNDRHFDILDEISFPKVKRLRLAQVKKSFFP